MRRSICRPVQRGRWLDQLLLESPLPAAELASLLRRGRVGQRERVPECTGRGEPRRPGVGGLSAGTAPGPWRHGHRLAGQPLGWRFEGRVAVKILNLALVTTTGQERLRREGSVLARLTHPGIARLLDAACWGPGSPTWCSST